MSTDICITFKLFSVSINPNSKFIDLYLADSFLNINYKLISETSIVIRFLFYLNFSLSFFYWEF